jgi:hypothetical protein
MSVDLDLLRAKCRQGHERILAVAEPLSQEQLGWRPSGTAHSIGFALWHTARADDNVQADLTGGELEWVSGRWAARWGHPERGVGTVWDDARAAALPLPPKDELFEYARRVFAAVDAAADGIDDERLSLAVTSRFIGGPSSAGDVLATCVVHDNRHLGEMEYIKGLLGLRGSATI